MPKAGRYHIARKIADGGMAEIFLGAQHGLEGFERPVVLKRILAPLLADPQFRNMLIDEAHVAMSLNHSNIVQVLDLGHVGGRYFLVLELVDGWDLSQLLARANAADFPVPPELLLYIAAEVCRALAYAHARTRAGKPLAIVHRDVSPQNVLISEQGEVKLTDFGIAKAMGRREHTSQGVIKGKLAFMSPEQASGSVLDNRSDLFALGTMLYLFFTGKRPFEAPTDLESIMRVRECRFTAPEVLRPGLNPEVVKVIRRALQLRPSDRYQSADEMLLALEDVQRTSYRPAGQTELKRWLADLQRRDRCPPISRAELAAPVASKAEELDLGVGAEVVFDESDVIDIEDIVQGMQPTLAATPAHLALPQPGAEGSASAKSDKSEGESSATPGTKSGDVNAKATKSEDKTTAATPAALGQSCLPARIIMLALLVAALAVGAWLAIPGNNSRTVQHRPRAERTKPTARKEHKKPAPAALPVPLDAGAANALDAGRAPAAHPRPTTVAPAAAHATASDNEEEHLLEHAEPPDSQRVIDEDEGVAIRKKRHVRTKVSAVTPTPVSVHLVSSPAGAEISIGKRVFGRAPMNLRFRPGITFEVTFVKRGYYPATRRFVPTGRKNQTVRVALKHRHVHRKSLFRRLFGR